MKSDEYYRNRPFTWWNCPERAWQGYHWRIWPWQPSHIFPEPNAYYLPVMMSSMDYHMDYHIFTNLVQWSSFCFHSQAWPWGCHPTAEWSSASPWGIYCPRSQLSLVCGWPLQVTTLGYRDLCCYWCIFSICHMDICWHFLPDSHQYFEAISPYINRGECSTTDNTLWSWSGNPNSCSCPSWAYKMSSRRRLLWWLFSIRHQYS